MTTENPSQQSSRADVNRQNAQHSTGPRTDAGKARSSQNATRSGWFTRDLRVAEEKIELYLRFEESWLHEIQPEGLFELEAFSDFLRASWHKREVIEARNQLAPAGASFLDDDREIARKFDRLHRYERDFERRAARALRELRRLQTERAAKSNPAAPAAGAGDTEAQAAAEPPLADAKVLLQKRTEAARRRSVPFTLAGDLCRDLYTMEIENPKPATGPECPA